MKATLLFSVLFSSSALAGVILPRQDASMPAGGEQPTSQNAAGGGGGGGGGASFKFAPLCKASGSATPDPPDLVAKQFMAYHNVHRTYHGACSLLWDPELAKTAQAAANTCKFQHQMTGDNGQNVAEQSASGNIPAGTVSMWYEEGSKTNYQGGNMQQGHYTQAVWMGTYALGCGVKNCGQMSLVFCNYAPAGNMMGAFEQNVGKRVANARPVCAEQQAMSQYANSGGGQGGSSGAGGKCITDQELGLPASPGGGAGGTGTGTSGATGTGGGDAGGTGAGTSGGTGTGGGGQMKKGKGGFRGNTQGGGGGGGGGGMLGPFAKLFQGGGGGMGGAGLGGAGLGGAGLGGAGLGGAGMGGG